MKWRTCGALATPYDRPLQLLVRRRAHSRKLPVLARGQREPPIERRDSQRSTVGWRAGDPLKPDAFGMLSPTADADLVTPVLVLTPLLAFDRRGGRLGQGGGHYDRIFAALKPRGVTAVGLAFAAQEVERVPSGPLDARMDWVVTEREAIRC